MTCRPSTRAAAVRSGRSRYPAKTTGPPSSTRPSSRSRTVRTGDLGTLDDHGCLTVIGRKTDTIVTGGENVAPAEVEAALLAHPAVADAGVFGRPDPEWGERVVAVVQPVDWSSAPDVESLRAFAADALEPAALPREVVTLGLLPVLDSGKPDKVAVRTLLRDRT